MAARFASLCLAAVATALVASPVMAQSSAEASDAFFTRIIAEHLALISDYPDKAIEHLTAHAENKFAVDKVQADLLRSRYTMNTLKVGKLTGCEVVGYKRVGSRLMHFIIAGNHEKATAYYAYAFRKTGTEWKVLAHSLLSGLDNVLDCVPLTTHAPAAEAKSSTLPISDEYLAFCKTHIALISKDVEKAVDAVLSNHAGLEDPMAATEWNSGLRKLIAFYYRLGQPQEVEVAGYKLLGSRTCYVVMTVSYEVGPVQFGYCFHRYGSGWKLLTFVANPDIELILRNTPFTIPPTK